MSDTAALASASNLLHGSILSQVLSPSVLVAQPLSQFPQARADVCVSVQDILLLLPVTSRVHTRKEPANGSWGYRNRTKPSHPVPPDWLLAEQQDQLLKAHPTQPQYQTGV